MDLRRSYCRTLTRVVVVVATTATFRAFLSYCSRLIKRGLRNPIIYLSMGVLIHALRVEIERLKPLIQSISKSPSGTSSLAMTDKNFNSPFNVSKTLCKDSWVLDSGATDHMTPHSSLLTSYVSLFGNYITVANGTHRPITGCGNVSLLHP